MKVGDKVKHKNRTDIAKVISIKVETTWDDFKEKPITKTSYVARFDSGALMKFYGYDIGKRIFKAEPDSEQLSMFGEN